MAKVVLTTYWCSCVKGFSLSAFLQHSIINLLGMFWQQNVYECIKRSTRVHTHKSRERRYSTHIRQCQKLDPLVKSWIPSDENYGILFGKFEWSFWKKFFFYFCWSHVSCDGCDKTWLTDGRFYGDFLTKLDGSVLKIIDGKNDHRIFKECFGQKLCMHAENGVCACT